MINFTYFTLGIRNQDGEYTDFYHFYLVQLIYDLIPQVTRKEGDRASGPPYIYRAKQSFWLCSLPFFHMIARISFLSSFLFFRVLFYVVKKKRKEKSSYIENVTKKSQIFLEIFTPRYVRLLRPIIFYSYLFACNAGNTLYNVGNFDRERHLLINIFLSASRQATLPSGI